MHFRVPMGHELAVGGKAADCQPMWVTVWVRRLTHILTHTIFSVFAAKKASKTEVFDAVWSVLTKKMQEP